MEVRQREESQLLVLYTDVSLYKYYLAYTGYINW